jgi:hypothetical protein
MRHRGHHSKDVELYVPKGPVDGFDLEAVRAKVEQALCEADEAAASARQAKEFRDEWGFVQACGAYERVLDLLGPKRKPNPDEVAIEALTHHYVYHGQDPSEFKRFAREYGPYVVEQLRSAGLLREGL